MATIYLKRHIFFSPHVMCGVPYLSLPTAFLIFLSATLVSCLSSSLHISTGCLCVSPPLLAPSAVLVVYQQPPEDKSWVYSPLHFSTGSKTLPEDEEESETVSAQRVVVDLGL